MPGIDPEATLDFLRSPKANTEVVKAVKEPAFGEQLKGLGIEIAGISRAELDAFRADQIKRISELVKAPGVDIK